MVHTRPAHALQPVTQITNALGLQNLRHAFNQPTPLALSIANLFTCIILGYGMVWYGMVWYGMVWYGMVWYGLAWYFIA